MGCPSSIWPIRASRRPRRHASPGPANGSRARLPLADGSVLYRSDKGADENWSIFKVGLDGKEPVDLTPGEKLQRDEPVVAAGAPEYDVLLGAQDGRPRQRALRAGAGRRGPNLAACSAKLSPGSCSTSPPTGSRPSGCAFSPSARATRCWSTSQCGKRPAAAPGGGKEGPRDRGRLRAPTASGCSSPATTPTAPRTWSSRSTPTPARRSPATSRSVPPPACCVGVCPSPRGDRLLTIGGGRRSLRAAPAGVRHAESRPPPSSCRSGRASRRRLPAGLLARTASGCSSPGPRPRRPPSCWRSTRRAAG